MLEKILKTAIGLNAMEIKAYLILLNIGPQPASIIAAKIACPRSSAYFVLEKALQKGIITYFLKKKIKYFAAISLPQIEAKLKEQEKSYCDRIKSIKQTRIELKKLFILKKNFQENKLYPDMEKIKLQTFIEFEGIKTIFSLIEEEKKEVFIYGFLDNQEKIGSFYNRFSLEQCLKFKKVRLIFNQEEKDKNLIDEICGNNKRNNCFEQKGLSANFFTTPKSQLIFCGNYTAFINEYCGNLHGFAIFSETYAQNLRIFYEQIWCL